jgi:hypothetical protein
LVCFRFISHFPLLVYNLGNRCLFGQYRQEENAALWTALASDEQQRDDIPEGGEGHGVGGNVVKHGTLQWW